MTRWGTIFAVGVALSLAGLALLTSTTRSGPAGPHLVSMAESVTTLQQAGQIMQTHGRVMLETGQLAGDADLVDQGAHWLRDGQALVQEGAWMAMDPTAPGSLHAARSDRQTQESWRTLNERVASMLHAPRQAGSTDWQALRDNGVAMQAEGQSMVDHGRVMAEDIVVMLSGHDLVAPAAADLRQAAQAMRTVGGHLAFNGQEMINYADRMLRSLGSP